MVDDVGTSRTEARHEGHKRSAKRGWVRRHKIVSALIALVLLSGLAVGLPYAWVGLVTRGKIHSVVNVPSAPVAIVFGAGIWDGKPSPYLQARLDGARQLYESGKVKAILVTGDNSAKNYDEPTAMRDWLVANGVPSAKIVLDYAGFSTRDSCVRAKKVFGVEDAIVVTQDYHVTRAVFTCATAGITVSGVGVPAIGGPIATYKAREFLATLNAALDVVRGTQPTFLGPKEDGIAKAIAARP